MALPEHGEQCPACGTSRLHRIKQAWVCPTCGFYEGCCEGEPAHAPAAVVEGKAKVKLNADAIGAFLKPAGR